MNRRDAIISTVGAAVGAALCRSARATLPIGGSSPLLVARPLGLNLASATYYDSQLPFLNVLLQSSNTLGTIWATKNSGGNTNEEPYLQLDSDGYVTSLTASPIPAGGQQFTKVDAATLVNVALANGATYAYPSDTYVFRWQGKGTFVFQGDVTSLSNASAGCTISGLQVSSTNAWGTISSVTLNGSGTGGVITPSSAGFRFDVTAIPDSGNYPKAMAIVQSTYLSLYNGGQIFHPLFLAWLGKFPLASLRFMKPQDIESDVLGGPYGTGLPCYFAGNPQSGVTSLSLGDGMSSITWSSGVVTVTLPTTPDTHVMPQYYNTVGQTFTSTVSGVTPSAYNGTYTVTVASPTSLTFSLVSNPGAATVLGNFTLPCSIVKPGTRTITLQNGQTILSTFTAGSPTVLLQTAVSSNCTSNYYYIHLTTGYSDRSLPSNVSYAVGKGWPLEVCCSLANTLSCNPWINILLTWSPADCGAAAGVIQSSLSSTLKAFIEIGNEVWNPSYAIQHWANDKSANLWGSANTDGISYYGMSVALAADQFATVFGNPGFDNRIACQMGGQAANTAVIVDALKTPKWTGNTPPWQRTSASGQKTIKGVCIAPYWGFGALTSAEYSFVEAQTDPVGTLLATLTQNPVSGQSFTYNGTNALPSGGWFAELTSWVTGTISAIAPYGAQQVNFYESGWQWEGGSGGTQTALMNAAARDARCQALFYQFFNAMASAGATVQTLFNFCESYISGDQWGAIESVMQPLSSPPPRMLGAIQWGSGL